MGPKPITDGSRPAAALLITEARGLIPWLSAYSREATTTAAPASLMPEALPAVTVPSFLNAGLRVPNPSAVVPARGCSSVSKVMGSPLRCGTSTGSISSLNRPFSTANRAALTLCGKLILVLPGDAVALSHILCSDAHVDVRQRTPESVLDHLIHHVTVTHTVTLASLGQKVRGRTHILHSPRNHHISVSGDHCLGGKVDCLETGATDLVNGHGRGLLRKAGFNARPTGRVLPESCLQDVPHYYLFHVSCVNSSPLQSLFDRQGPQCGSRHRREGSEKAPHRCAAGAQDYCFARQRYLLV